MTFDVACEKLRTPWQPREMPKAAPPPPCYPREGPAKTTRQDTAHRMRAMDGCNAIFARYAQKMPVQAGW